MLTTALPNFAPTNLITLQWSCLQTQIFSYGCTFYQLFNPFSIHLDAFLKIFNGTPAGDTVTMELFQRKIDALVGLTLFFVNLSKNFFFTK